MNRHHTNTPHHNTAIALLQVCAGLVVALCKMVFGYKVVMSLVDECV